MSDHSSSSEAESSTFTAAPIAGKAPHRHLPRTTFAAVEYPSTVSHPSALLKVMTQDNINECFNSPAGAAAILEMSYRMDDRSGIPVRGSRVPSSRLLLRIKRRRRRSGDSEEDEEADRPGLADRKGKGRDVEGVFTADIIGAITQTVRFRQLADFHYTPNPEGRVTSLANAMKELDYDAILDYSVPRLDEDFVEAVEPPLGEDPPAHFIPFRSVSDLQPTPLFSQRFVAPVYGFKNSAQSQIEEVKDQYTGEIRLRYVNKARAIAGGPQRIGHGHARNKVPSVPTKKVKDTIDKLEPALLEKLKQVLERRPIWLRHGLLAQFDKDEQRLFNNDKTYFAAVCYVFGAGPYAKCYIRLGYDPRVDVKDRVYQRIYFYLKVQRSKTTMLRAQSVDSDEEEEESEEVVDKEGKGWWELEQKRRIEAGEREPLDPTKAYIFDGQILHRDKPDYQLCDIYDPLVRKYIDDPNCFAEACKTKDGWYKPAALAAIRNMCKIKYRYLREYGKEAPNELCYNEIEKFEREMRGKGGKGNENEEQVEDEGQVEDVDMED